MQGCALRFMFAKQMLHLKIDRDKAAVYFHSAGNRTRTGTMFPSRDFKSLVSTIPPHRRIYKIGGASEWCDPLRILFDARLYIQKYILPDLRPNTNYLHTYSATRETSLCFGERPLTSGPRLTPTFSSCTVAQGEPQPSTPKRVGRRGRTLTTGVSQHEAPGQE